jgi:hypothetical protein
MKRFVKKYSSWLMILIVVLISIPIILPFFVQGFFPTHDGEWTVVRLADMYRTLKDGQFPARYSGYLNYQYGYPLFNFAYPLPYYIGLIFVFLQFGFVNSIKILFILSTIISAVGMYMLGSQLWKKREAGVFVAALFLYWPYRMIDLYVRGSLGEVIALGLIPWMFFLILYATQKQSKIALILSGIVLGAVILSHNIQSLLFIPIFFLFALFFSFVYYKKAKLYPFIASVIGIVISVFFWLPALAEKKIILLSIIPIADRSLYFVTLSDLFIPSWGYGIPTDVLNRFSYQIGTAHILTVIACGVVLITSYLKSKKDEYKSFMVALFSIVSIMIAMMFQFTEKIWELLPLISEINYPWTLLAPIGFVISLMGGYIVRKNLFLNLIVWGILFVACVYGLMYAKPSEHVHRGDDFYSTNTGSTTSSQEYTPLWVKELPLESPANIAEISKGQATVDSAIKSSNKISFNVTAQTESIFTINTIYYPGWDLYVNNNKQTINYENKKGLITGKVPTGNSTVVARFRETPLRMTANVISGLGIVGCLVFIGLQFKGTYAKK